MLHKRNTYNCRFNIIKHFSVGSLFTLMRYQFRNLDGNYSESLRSALVFARSLNARIRLKRSGFWFDIPGRTREPMHLHARMFPSSDMLVLRQIIQYGEYGPAVEFLANKGMDGRKVHVVDAGANVGYTSIRVAGAVPDATVICIEPDEGNYLELERNIRANAVDARLVKGALWDSDTDLALGMDFRDGKEWSYYCVQSEDGSVHGWTLETLVNKYNIPHIDFLKIDIEGAEFRLFSSVDFVAFIADRVLLIGVEVHSEFGRECEITTVLSEKGFRLFRDGETLYGLSSKVPTESISSFLFEM